LKPAARRSVTYKVLKYYAKSPQFPIQLHKDFRVSGKYTFNLAKRNQIGHRPVIHHGQEDFWSQREIKEVADGFLWSVKVDTTDIIAN
jgi:hypothetical protein